MKTAWIVSTIAAVGVVLSTLYLRPTVVGPTPGGMSVSSAATHPVETANFAVSPKPIRQAYPK